MNCGKIIVARCIIVSIVGLSATMGFAYEYPAIDYNSQAWRSFSSAEKEAAFQIPDEVVVEMPTEELIQAYLDFPLIGFIYAYNSRQKGFEVVRDKFNGIDEIYRRRDSGTKLIEFYKKMDPSAYNMNWPPLEIGQFGHRILSIELLLAQEPILLRLKKPEIKSLISEGLKKLELKRTHDHVFGRFGREITAFLLAMIIESRREANGFRDVLLQTRGMRDFLEAVRFPNREISSNIIQLARRFLHNY